MQMLVFLMDHCHYKVILDISKMIVHQLDEINVMVKSNLADLDANDGLLD